MYHVVPIYRIAHLILRHLNPQIFPLEVRFKAPQPVRGAAKSGPVVIVATWQFLMLNQQHEFVENDDVYTVYLYIVYISRAFLKFLSCSIAPLTQEILTVQGSWS